MAKRIHKISDITADIRGNNLILEQQSHRKEQSKRLIHLSGVIQKKTWRMRWTDFLLSIAYIKRSFQSLMYGRATPLDLSKSKHSSQIPGDGYAGPIKNSLWYWASKPALNLAGVFILIVIGINTFLAVYDGSKVTDEFVAASRSGVDALMSAKDSILQFDFALAADEFTEAKNNFSVARDNLGQVTRTVHLLSESPLNTGNALVYVGEQLSVAGEQFTTAVQQFQATLNISDSLESFFLGYRALLDADNTLQQIDPASLRPLEDEIRAAQTTLHEIRLHLEKIDHMIPVAKRAMGFEKPMKYLIAFQNTAEKRGTGGFLGSFALATFEQGKLVSLEPEDIYRIDWCLKDGVTLPDAPEPMRGMIEQFHMRDANYSPDFPTSAKWITWFFENTCDGEAIDGVIAIDQTLLQEILRLVGSVTLQDPNITITADNYFETLQFYIETEKEQSRIVQSDGRYGTPKQVLLDLITVIEDKLRNFPAKQSLAAMLIEKGQKRHIQAYFKDTAIQEFIVSLGIDGALVKSEEDLDYVSVIHTNVGGNKSDRYIKESLQHSTAVAIDGVVTDTVTIKRTHTFDDAALRTMHQKAPQITRDSDSIAQQQHVEFVLGNGPNKTYTRVFVPEGSILQSASGIAFEDIIVTHESDKGVFAYNSELAQGATEEISLTYVLPFVLDLDSVDTYRLVAQKQAGSEGVLFTQKLILDEGVEIARNTDSASDVPLSYDTDLDHDRYFINVLKHE